MPKLSNHPQLSHQAMDAPFFFQPDLGGGEGGACRTLGPW